MKVFIYITSVSVTSDLVTITLSLSEDHEALEIRSESEISAPGTVATNALIAAANSSLVKVY